MGTRILIADDHEVVRKGIRDIIRQARPEWIISGEADNGAEAVELTKTLKPDVVILDISMPGMSGVEAASRIAGARLGSRVLLFTMYESKKLAMAVRQSGAQGYVLKSQAANHLIRAIDCVVTGDTFFDGTDPDCLHGEESSSGNKRLGCEDSGN